MIRFDCGAAHPHFKPLVEPAPMREMPYQVCGEVRSCVPNQKFGLPEKFQTADETFKLIAENLKGDDGHRVRVTGAPMGWRYPLDKGPARTYCN